MTGSTAETEEEGLFWIESMPLGIGGPQPGGGGGPQFVPESACAPQAATRNSCMQRASLNYEFRILNHEFAVPNGTAATRSRRSMRNVLCRARSRSDRQPAAAPLAKGCSSTSQAPPPDCGLDPSGTRSRRDRWAAASPREGPKQLHATGKP